MTQPWSIGILSLLVLTAIGCLFAAFAIWRLARRLNTLLLPDEDEQFSGDELYSWFIQAESRIRGGLTVWLYLWAIFSYFAYTATYGLNTIFSLSPWPHTVEANIIYALLYPAPILIPLAVFELWAATTLERRALQQTREMTISATVALRRRLRLVLWLYPATFLLLFGIGLVQRVYANSWEWVYPLVPALWLSLNLLVIGRVRRWLYPSYPISETDWADQEWRIREWARLAGVELKAIYIQSTTETGKAPLDITGLRRHTLYLSDLWLNSTDWRQQDAMLCTLLARARYRVTSFCIEVVGVLGVAVVLAAFNWASDSSLAIFGFLKDLPTLGFVPLVLMALLLYRWSKRLLMAADCFAVVLTGDPYALLVALQTWGVLNGMPLSNDIVLFGRRADEWLPWLGWHLAEERGIGPIFALWALFTLYLPCTLMPSIATRSRAIDAYMRTDAPHAPWATTPVPALTPLFLGGSYPITAPIETMPPAAPVPVSPYPHTLLFAPEPAALS